MKNKIIILILYFKTTNILKINYYNIKNIYVNYNI